MKLNKEIYSSDRSISIDFLSGIKTTQSLETLVNNGKLQLNNLIDETIFYAVDFNPPDDYFVRSGNTKPHQSEFVTGTNTPSGVCAMFGRLKTTDALEIYNTDTLQNRPVFANQYQTTNIRLAYDSNNSSGLLFWHRIQINRFCFFGSGDCI